VSNAADLVDSVIFGNVSQTTTDCSYLARHVGLGAGVGISKPMLTVNRLCGSGFQALINAAQEIQLGEAEVVLAGGAESMSKAPMTLHGTRWGHPLGKDIPLVDSLWEGLTDLQAKCTMSMTAENLAEEYKVGRREADEWSAQSQARYADALKRGVYQDEIAPVTLTTGKAKGTTFARDEHPRPQSDLASLQGLKALFKKDGTVTAGTASGICDGAAALLVVSEDAVKRHGFKPLAKLVSYAYVGVPPHIMGLGPVPAVKKALEKAGKTVADMDLYEINEAFASQLVVCKNELKLDAAKLNVDGGAVAMGHPTGASGARIMGHLAMQLQARNLKRAFGAACIGGGQGIAVVIEKV